jgi:hypothetical protein
MTYIEKLKNPRWQRKRLKILERDNFACQFCGDKETELHIHHLKYKGEPWDVEDEFLKTVCKDCHFVIYIEEKNGGKITKDGNFKMIKYLRPHHTGDFLFMILIVDIGPFFYVIHNGFCEEANFIPKELIEIIYNFNKTHNPDE